MSWGVYSVNSFCEYSQPPFRGVVEDPTLGTSIDKAQGLFVVKKYLYTIMSCCSVLHCVAVCADKAQGLFVINKHLYTIISWRV